MIRGGRSGPSAAKVSTHGATVGNAVGVKTGAGTASAALRIAPTEQQEAQALHLWVLGSLTLAAAAKLAEADKSSSAAAATPSCR